MAQAVVEIAQATHRRQPDVFQDFVDMCYCALAQRAPGCRPERTAELEAEYMRTIKPYAEREERHRFPQMMAETGRLLNGGGHDALGEAAGEIEALNPHMGQFFTPYEVSRMMAEATLTDAPRIVEEQGYITIMEPACGAGGMVVAAADALAGHGVDLAKDVLVHAQDLDHRCHRMTYVQMCLRGVSGWAGHGNSLSLEVFGGDWTHATREFYDKHGHLFEGPQDDPPTRHRARPVRIRRRPAA